MRWTLLRPLDDLEQQLVADIFRPEKISSQNQQSTKVPFILIKPIKFTLKMKDRAYRKNLQKKLAYYTPSPYAKALSKYSRSTAKTIDPLLRSIANRSPHARFFPVYQFLRAAARLFLLQQLQLLVVAYRFQTCGWEVDDEVIVRGADWMGQLFCCPSQRNEYRQVTLYIMLVCFWAKSALNQNCAYLLDEVRRICHNFNNIFQEWLGRSKQELVISPPLLNRLYSLLSDRNPLQYHFIVDQIVQLSHAYNSDKEQNCDKRRSYSFCERQSSSYSEELQQDLRKKVKPQVSFNSPNFIKIQKEEIKEDSIYVFGNHRLGQSQKFTRFFEQSFSASMHFPSMQYSHKPQMDLDYIEVGLCQGQSADLVVLNPPGEMTLPSMILGHKGVSNMENSFLGMREMRQISLIQLKDQSEIFEKQLREKVSEHCQKK